MKVYFPTQAQNNYIQTKNMLAINQKVEEDQSSLLKITPESLSSFRKEHAGWILLSEQKFALTILALYRLFFEKGLRRVAEKELVEQLDNVLFDLGVEFGQDFISNSNASKYQACDLISEWSQDSFGKFYLLKNFAPEGSDSDYIYDLSPAAQSALVWVEQMHRKDFVGSESRLKLVYELLDELFLAASPDQSKVLENLLEQKRKIEQKILEAQTGQCLVASDREIREMFQNLEHSARRVSEAFREMDKHNREIAADISKELSRGNTSRSDTLKNSFEAILRLEESDQGKSFKGFMQMLSDPELSAQFQKKLEYILASKALEKADSGVVEFLKNSLSAWTAAANSSVEVISMLDARLRQLLSKRNWKDEKAVVECVDRVLDLLNKAPNELISDEFEVHLREAAPNWEFPMTYDLHTVKQSAVFESSSLEQGISSGQGLAALAGEAKKIQTKQVKGFIVDYFIKNPKVQQTCLAKLLEQKPLNQGLDEFAAYWAVLRSCPDVELVPGEIQQISWQCENGLVLSAQCQKLVIPKEVCAHLEADLKSGADTLV